MRIVFHLGAHCTDDERLIRCLLKNRGLLAAQGIIVPGPAHYRSLIRTLVRRDVLGRYSGSYGGAFWARYRLA